jgi:arylsulfatase A-like enzyme
MFEGGIRVPFLAQWKGTLPAGVVYPEMVMAFDIHATALAAAGFGVPPSGGQATEPAEAGTPNLDGVNLLPFLTGKQKGRPHEELFWRSGDNHAARVGDWKLVRERGGEDQLFNLKKDIGETTDLAVEEPARLKELQVAYAAWDEKMMPAQWRRQDGRTQGEAGAKAGAARGGGIAARFEQFDRNGDGKITPAEFPRADVFKQMDKSGDGAVTPDEARTYFRGNRWEPTARERKP